MQKQYSPFKLAVLGHPVGHSLSPIIHQHFAAQHQRVVDYQKIDLQSEEAFMTFVDQSVDDYVGFNVTVPYKQCLLEYANKYADLCIVSAIANQAGAANTIAYYHANTFQHRIANTDGQGFLNHLQRLAFDVHDKKILIIGAGGATMGLLAQFVAVDHISQYAVYVCNRTEKKAQDLADKYGVCHWTNGDNQSVEFDLIVNATAQGLDGSVYENAYFNDKNVHGATYFYDLFYDKKQQTPFLNYIAEHYPHNIFTDGLGMLIEQAALSYEIWFGELPSTDALYSIMRL